jgi:hypothetical protein
VFRYLSFITDPLILSLLSLFPLYLFFLATYSF